MLRDEGLKAIRAKNIIALRTEDNLSNTEIAERLNVHPDTVRRSLTWAKKAGLFVQYEDQVLKDVVPMAIEALKTALADGDGELAVKVLNNTLWAAQAAVKNKTQVAPSGGSDSGNDDFAAAIAQIRAAAAKAEETVDGETVDEPQKPLLMEGTASGEF